MSLIFLRYTFAKSISLIHPITFAGILELEQTSLLKFIFHVTKQFEFGSFLNSIFSAYICSDATVLNASYSRSGLAKVEVWFLPHHLFAQRFPPVVGGMCPTAAQADAPAVRKLTGVFF